MLSLKPRSSKSFIQTIVNMYTPKIEMHADILFGLKYPIEKTINISR